ncbi:MAG: hypothetical protein GXP33_04425 [Spirochaetes bacterium]|nr:hypothetical protein [Spirochaetota bacterium]
MGLLDKALILSESKTSEAKGLLQKTISILDMVESGKPAASLITQEELDILSANNKKHKERGKEQLFKKPVSVKPASVPLTWSEANKSAPQYHSPRIEKKEINNLLEPSVNEGETEDSNEYSGVSSAILKEIQSIEEGIETPAFLFAMLKNKLGITKGALLLYDPLKMVFAPWASSGYDTTTMHRLRIPLGFSESFNETAEGKTVVITEEQKLKEYKSFFSNREFNLISRLIIAPLISKNKLVSILLITEAAEEIDNEPLDIIISNISSQLTQKIYNAREKKMQLLKKIEPEELESLENTIDKHITYALEKEFSFVLVLLKLSDFIKSVASGTSSLIDPFRLSEDITKILQSLFYNMGNIFEVEPGVYIISLFKIKNPDMDLIFDQAAYTIKHFFNSIDRESTAVPDIQYSYKMYPQNGKSSKELLADLM